MTGSKYPGNIKAKVYFRESKWCDEDLILKGSPLKILEMIYITARLNAIIAIRPSKPGVGIRYSVKSTNEYVSTVIDAKYPIAFIYFFENIYKSPNYFLKGLVSIQLFFGHMKFAEQIWANKAKPPVK